MVSSRKERVIDSALGFAVYSDFSESLFNADGFLRGRLPKKFYANQLHRLECFVDDLLSTDEIPFLPRLSRFGDTEYDISKLCDNYFFLLPNFIEVVKMLAPWYVYSERITVFISCCKSQGLLQQTLVLGTRDIWFVAATRLPQFGGVTAGELFNTLVNNIRAEWKAQELGTKLRKRRAEMHKRFTDYCAYVDSLFDACAKQLVLRVDLYYRRELFDRVTVHDAVTDFNHLVANMRGCQSIFGAMNGYIAKLDYGIEKGVHIHTIFFFDSSKRNNANHNYLAMQVGEYWVRVITKCNGAYWNVSAMASDDENLRIRGIGVIHANARQVRANLTNVVVRYLCKMDQFLRPKFHRQVHLIRRGNLPKVPIIKRGRPRKASER